MKLNKTPPLVSVIIPIYNVEQYLDKCMESIVNQTYKNLEIILVDDGSPDNCPKLCDNWAKKDDRIIVIHKENAGLGMARNSGLKVATGKYVMFTDSDDYISTKMVQILYDKLLQTGSDTVYCGLNRIINNEKIIKVSSLYDNEIFQNEEIVDKILFRMLGNKPELDNDEYFYMSVWHALYSIDIIKNNNIRFPSEREFMSEDLSFHIDYLGHAKKVTCISDNLYYYRVSENSLSVKFDPNRFARIKKLHFQVLEKLNNVMDSERYLTIENGWFLSMTRGQMMNVIKRKDEKPISKIKALTEDPLVQSVIKKYPYNRNPVKRRIFNFLIDKKRNFLLYIAIKLYSK